MLKKDIDECVFQYYEYYGNFGRDMEQFHESNSEMAECDHLTYEV